MDAQLSYLQAESDRAAYFGAEIFRTDIYHDERIHNPYDDKVLHAVRKLADACREKGMTLVTENHGGYLYSAERLEKFISLVDHANFGLLCDLGNFASEDEDPAEAVCRLQYFIRHVHLKDAHLKDGTGIYPGEGWYVTRGGNYWRCAISGQGNIPLCKCLKMLEQAGYTGWLVQEFEGLEDCVYAATHGLRYTKKALESLKFDTWQKP